MLAVFDRPASNTIVSPRPPQSSTCRRVPSLVATNRSSGGGGAAEQAVRRARTAANRANAIHALYGRSQVSVARAGVANDCRASTGRRYAVR